MQEYMIEKNKGSSQEITESVSDEAVVSFRKIIENKKSRKTEKTEEKPREEMEHASVFSYMATACLVLAVLAVGAGFYRNYMGDTELSKRNSTVTVASEKAVEEASITPEITWIAEEDISEETQIKDETVDDASAVTQESEQETEEQEVRQTGQETEQQEVKQTGQEIEQQEVQQTGQETEQQEVRETEMMSESENPQITEILSETETAGTSQTVEEHQFSQEADERKIKKEEPASSDHVLENYMIKPGDTLYQISISHYGNTDAIPEICRLNNLTENQVIYPGQMIVLP